MPAGFPWNLHSLRAATVQRASKDHGRAHLKIGSRFRPSADFAERRSARRTTGLRHPDAEIERPTSCASPGAASSLFLFSTRPPFPDRKQKTRMHDDDVAMRPDRPIRAEASQLIDRRWHEVIQSAPAGQQHPIGGEGPQHSVHILVKMILHGNRR